MLAHTDEVELSQARLLQPCRRSPYRVRYEGSRVAKRALVEHVGRVAQAERRASRCWVPRQAADRLANEGRCRSNAHADCLATHVHHVRTARHSQKVADRRDAVPSKWAHICRIKVGIHDLLLVRVLSEKRADHVRHEQVAEVMATECAEEDEHGALGIAALVARHVSMPACS